MAIKDDIPGFHLNSVLHDGSKNPKTLPLGYDYEIPLSLNAETCFSEFVNVEKKTTTASGKAVKVNNNKNSEVDDMRDLSDFLFNSYAEA